MRSSRERYPGHGHATLEPAIRVWCPERSGLEAGINGTWFLLTVATESIAVLGALLLPRHDSDALAYTCLALFCLGLVLYLIVMTMVFLRWTFVTVARGRRAAGLGTARRRRPPTRR
jgi:tellurite resistance protein TehA-like permease